MSNIMSNLYSPHILLCEVEMMSPKVAKLRSLRKLGTSYTETVVCHHTMYSVWKIYSLFSRVLQVNVTTSSAVGNSTSQKAIMASTCMTSSKLNISPCSCISLDLVRGDKIFFGGWIYFLRKVNLFFLLSF